MRLDAISTPSIKTNGSIARPGSEKAPELSRGDVIQARVLSVSDGTASLRTSDGTLLQARLENGVHLSPGADVFLSVRDSGTDVIVLSPVNPGLESPVLRQAAADPLLGAIFDQLTALGYEPTAENMSAMRQMLAEVPNMSMQEAAFFAAQKLEPEPAILDAFRAIVSGETDTAALLDRLATVSSSLAEASPAFTPAEGTSIPAYGIPLEPAPGTASASGLPQEPALETAPGTTPEASQVSATVTTPESHAAESQTPVPVVIADTPESAAIKGGNPPVTVENQPVSAGSQAAVPETGSYAAAPQVPADPPEFGRWLLDALGAGISKSEGSTGGAPVLTGEALASSPLLEGLSERSLSGMAESLNRIAEGMPKSGSEAELFENISKFAKELFSRLDGDDDNKLHERLKEVREDLYIKLAYFRDAVASSSSPSKGVVLEQTGKLMDHLRLLNGLDQFVCVQIPVQFGDQNRNADLYIYKREKNGSSHIDPENVKILLALELQYMGNLETLIEIQGRDVSLRIEAANDDVVNALRQNTAKIHKLLDSIGYKFANSTFVTKKSDTTIETALLSLLEIERGRSGGINMFI